MKKLTNYLIIFFSLVFLTACNAALETSNQEPNDDKSLSGLYIYGHEVNSFQLCGDSKVYWVEGSNRVLELLEVSYFKLVSEPYDEVFVKIVGGFSAKEKDGFAADYDGVVNVENLLLMRKKSEAVCK